MYSGGGGGGGGPAQVVERRPGGAQVNPEGWWHQVDSEAVRVGLGRAVALCHRPATWPEFEKV
jgi:hypothetical protein